jgi:hypothetical protein
MMIENKAQLREQLIYWADNADLKRVLVSHGDPIEGDLSGVFRELADTLT